MTACSSQRMNTGAWYPKPRPHSASAGLAPPRTQPLVRRPVTWQVCFTVGAERLTASPSLPSCPPPGELSLQPLAEALSPGNIAALFVAVLLERRVLLRVRDGGGSGGHRPCARGTAAAPGGRLRSRSVAAAHDVDGRHRARSGDSGPPRPPTPAPGPILPAPGAQSRQYRLLTLVAESVVALLHPFKFQHVYIPVMPYSLVDYLEVGALVLLCSGAFVRWCHRRCQAAVPCARQPAGRAMLGVMLGVVAGGARLAQWGAAPGSLGRLSGSRSRVLHTQAPTPFLMGLHSLDELEGGAQVWGSNQGDRHGAGPPQRQARARLTKRSDARLAVTRGGRRQCELAGRCVCTFWQAARHPKRALCAAAPHVLASLSVGGPGGCGPGGGQCDRRPPAAALRGASLRAAPHGAPQV